MKRCLIPFFLIFFIVGCFFGPVKELKNQIEDTWDADTPIVPPTELIDISNSKKFSRLWTAHSGT